MPLTPLNPFVITEDLLQLLGGCVAFLRHRGSLPDVESYDQQVSYRLPVEGSWTVDGSPEQEHSHSWTDEETPLRDVSPEPVAP